ncbi:glutathione-disulfide reductase GRX7 SKDI_02G1210 [Saccharomyces kudriavzevii IFO 1802]|uniref:Uncharacterized protein n=2 Tax=Saccharomyces kudriavzevii (strain ATCC MYA-4449 / AS 2.2408 / CBS 8840 / NBRC 1802 / NCYC 2889) TaxID=226230 RepID=A0AA35NMM5_SACK1|nr:uncharacterized protein SKDI_02G1210 [Saccharomyces kudriavzevii IFO 1802]EJT43598.1 GRX7-like protein [Saccharomyces kudriavzevii IFO 1802]CAI4055199.1 hypothetical protein SKDI_02G1210 [Saccharomyces kudriavzevii IFO 1802]
MAIVINKRNVRVLVITNILLILVFLVVRSSNADASEAVKIIHPGSLATFDQSGNAPGTPESADKAVTNKQDKEVGETNEDSKGVTFDAAAEYGKILEYSPFVVFSKTGCPYSKKLKSLLAESYAITPSYYVVELDEHEHGKELKDYIGDKTGRSTVPNVVINGISRGGYTEMAALHENDTLVDSFKEWSSDKFTVKATSQSERT